MTDIMCGVRVGLSRMASGDQSMDLTSDRRRERGCGMADSSKSEKSGMDETEFKRKLKRLLESPPKPQKGKRDQKDKGDEGDGR